MKGTFGTGEDICKSFIYDKELIQKKKYINNSYRSNAENQVSTKNRQDNWTDFFPKKTHKNGQQVHKVPKSLITREMQLVSSHICEWLVNKIRIINKVDGGCKEREPTLSENVKLSGTNSGKQKMEILKN